MNELLTTNEAAKALGVCRQTLAKMPIPCVRIGKKHRRYRRADIEAFTSGAVQPGRAFKYGPAEQEIIEASKAIRLRIFDIGHAVAERLDEKKSALAVHARMILAALDEIEIAVCGAVQPRDQFDRAVGDTADRFNATFWSQP